MSTKTVQALAVEGCGRCGAKVARLRSKRTRNLYSVEIRDVVVGDALPLVGVADFHNCDPTAVEAYRAGQAQALGLNFSGIAAFFRSALAKGAKKLVICLQTDEEVTVELRHSASKGVLYVTDGGPWGDNRYFGAIDLASGAFRVGRESSPPVNALLTEFEADPAGVAARYGHLTGRCSFCARNLDDVRSVDVGYGPVCAKRYGLPWGERAAVDSAASGRDLFKAIA